MPGLSTDQLVLDRARYADVRPAARARILPVRALRRVQVGPHLAVGFENEETVRYQVQEMVYVEGITDENGAAHEIETYQRLVPSDNCLMATMLLEFTDVHTVRQELDSLTGIQHLVQLHVGDHVITGVDVPPPDEADTAQTFTVHFLRFRFDAAALATMADASVPVRLSVDHPNYRASVDVPAETRAELLADLGLA